MNFQTTKLHYQSISHSHDAQNLRVKTHFDQLLLSDFIHILQCFTVSPFSSVKWKLIRRNLKTFNFPTREKTNFGGNKHEDQTKQLSCHNTTVPSKVVIGRWVGTPRLCKCSLLLSLIKLTLPSNLAFKKMKMLGCC